MELLKLWSTVVELTKLWSVVVEFMKVGMEVESTRAHEVTNSTTTRRRVNTEAYLEISIWIIPFYNSLSLFSAHEH